MSKKIFSLIFGILVLDLACKPSDNSVNPNAQIPNSLFYTSKNELFVCNGETITSSEANIQGTKPIQFSLLINPENVKITIDNLGKIKIASDSPTGTFKISVKASNVFGSQTFDNIITAYVSALNPIGVNFADHIKPLVSSKCDPCHTNGGGKDWTNSENTKSYILKIIEKTTSGEMPQGEPPLSQTEVQLFRDWLNNCFLEKKP